MIQDFDAVAHELNHAADFEKSKSLLLEISSQHNYNDGITYFYLHSGDLELGHYYKNPWGDGWYWFSSISGEKNRCPSKAIALTKLQQSALPIRRCYATSVRSSARMRWSR